MLDLLITYINFLILSISYIVKSFTFFPPKPPKYITVKTDKEDEDAILFLINTKKNQGKYIEIKFKLLEYRFIKIINKYDEVLPLLLFIPPSHIPVCIIYSHGNSGDLGACILEFYDIAINTNCLVVSFEYPGFGDCMNQPLKESLFYRNIKIAYHFVRKILEYKPEQIILYGFSIGTGITFDFACHKEYPTAGMILQSPVLSVIRTLYNINATFYFDLFNNCDKAKNLKTKTFFIHGNNDTVVPYIHGRILAKLIPQEYLYGFYTVENANHNNLFKNKKDLIFKKIREFIKDCTGQFTDFSKLIIEENSSSNTTIDNNNINNSENSNNKKNNKDLDESNNAINDLYNRMLNKSNISYGQIQSSDIKNELNPLMIKKLENNNKQNILNPNNLNNYTFNNNKTNNNIDKNSYIKQMQDTFAKNFFGYNPHDLQNDLDIYMNDTNYSNKFDNSRSINNLFT